MTFAAFLTEEEIKDLQAQEAASDKEQKRTAEQIEAIYTNGNNVLVSASAGSGKTFVMVERILDKLKRGISVDQLFISTFTVKAAGELKERIEQKLNKAIAETDNQDLRLHLSAQLSEVENADIGTMDAFTQKLVSTYGYTLGLSPNFRILQDKNEQDLLKQEVFADLFSDYLQGEQAQLFTRLVKNFSGNSKDERKFREIVYQIHAFSQSTSNPTLWLKENLLCGHQNFTSIEDVPVSMVEGLLSAMIQAADDLEDLTDLADYKKTTKKGEPTANYKKHAAIFTNLRRMVGDLQGFDSQYSLLDLLEEAASILPSGSEVTVAGVKYPVFKQVKGRLQQLQHLSLILHYQPQALPMLELLQAFVLDFSSQYLQRKIQENSFEFSDISHLAIEILEENPLIRELYQKQYHEVMVDEYQDNNHTQERMLDLLSNGHNRFMVGDVKQSIYRFRQADPQIFQEKFERYQADPTAGKLILLKENFRSQMEVLDATNAIFTRLMDKEVGQIKYDQTHALVAGRDRQKIAQPQHQMEYLLYDTDIAEDEDTEISSGEVLLVAKEIIRLHNEEDVAFSDITLLVPSRTRNEAILSVFEEHGIPLVSDGGEANYLQSVEVMVMLDTLRAINNPLQDYALIALLKSPMFAFDEDELTRIALQADSGNFYDKIKQALNQAGKEPQLIVPSLAKKLQHFEVYLQSWRRFSKNRPIYDLIWKIFNEKFYYDYVGALPNGEKRQANLYALGLRANQFEKTGFKGLSRFIRMIDKLLASQNDLADVEVALPQNAVQLMTVHKSKGLEFKYVFLLNMDKNFNAIESRSSVILSRENGLGVQYMADMKDQFETDLPHVRVQINTLPYLLNQQELRIANLSEQMRLLYVAMTRAEQKLYLVGKGSQEKLADKYDGKRSAGVLLTSNRENMTNFQDWVLAIAQAFSDEALYFTSQFVKSEDLTPEKIGVLKQELKVDVDNLADNRQSEDISAALDLLASVDKVNQNYAAAIALPSLRTPSQIKKLYEPVLADEGLEIMVKEPRMPKFDLPDFSEKPRVTGAQIGSAVHELMQRIPLEKKPDQDLLRKTLAQVRADDAVKEKIDLGKIERFFATELGQEILENQDKVRREVPFSSLELDTASQEHFVLRGIIDGFIHYSDRIVLFDYKTDKYSQKEQMRERYAQQMQLYASALQKAYDVSQVDQHLILLGGDEIEVLPLKG